MVTQEKPKAKDKFLNPPEAADFLTVQPQTLAKWRMDGRNLPYIKVGRSVRYKLSDLQAFIEKQTVAAS